MKDARDLLIASTDGEGIFVRQDGLREGKRTHLEARRHKPQTGVSKGENRNCKRMATGASV